MAGPVRRPGASAGAGAAEGVRPEWLLDLIDASQRFVCELSQEPPVDLRRAAARLVGTISRPATHVEDAVLRSVLARLALRLTKQLWGRRSSSPLERDAENVLLDEHSPAADLFLRWGEHGVRRVHRNYAHLARTAAAILQQEKPPVSALSASLCCAERQLLRAFQRTYGMSPREYRKRFLVLRAFDLLRLSDLKNEAIAAECGSSSVKGLYRATRSVLGLTPLNIRKLDAAGASRLRQRLECSLGVGLGRASQPHAASL